MKLPPVKKLLFFRAEVQKYGYQYKRLQISALNKLVPY